MRRPIHLGESDFITLRRAGGLWIDKSVFLSRVLGDAAKVLLFPRPRRFGKTINQTMLAAFLEPGEDRSALFSDLEVWNDPVARTFFGRRPVVFLSFRSVKSGTWAASERQLRVLLANEVRRHSYLLDSASVEPSARDELAALMRHEGDPPAALRRLTEALHRHHGVPPFVLIDEHDTPILDGFQSGYYDEAVRWFRGFLTEGLKDNPHLGKGVLTGILRVAKESLFSGLNQLKVYSLLHPHHADSFGFATTEVEVILQEYGLAEHLAEVTRWYNGYRFGTLGGPGATIYNPWSILCFARDGTGFERPYWLNTSDNALIRQLLLAADRDQKAQMEVLLADGAVEAEIEEDVTLRDIQAGALWSLCLFSGYLRADEARIEEGRTLASLKLPNREVALLWTGTFRDWLRGTGGTLAPIHAAVLQGDAGEIQDLLQDMADLHFSSHDVKGPQIEAFYHAFVLGLLVTMEPTHAVRSNRESGRGRADVLVVPKRPGEPGVVMEFKRVREGESFEVALEKARAQIQDQRYTRELEAAGAAPIRRLAVAFSGRKVRAVEG